MKKSSAFLTRHRNLLLIVLLASTLAVSSESNRRRLSQERQTSLPVMLTQNSPVAVYTAEQDSAYLTSVAALQALCAEESLDERTREDAAVRLTQMVANREAQQALEAALAQSGLAPCAAVVTGGSVTIVTENPAFTDEDTALLLTLAAAHANADPADVRIICTE